MERVTACLHAANQLTAESGEDVSLPVDVDKYVIPAFSTSRDTAGGVEQRSDVDIGGSHKECETCCDQGRCVHFLRST